MASGEGQLYLDVQLKKKSNYLMQFLIDNSLISLLSIGLILLCLMVTLAYYIAKYLGKGKVKTIQ